MRCLLISILVMAVCTPATGQFLWSIEDGGNGHFYEQIFTPGMTRDWATSKAASERMTHLGMAGHLVTITNPEEQQFVESVYDGKKSWIGLTDDPLFGGTESSGLPNPKLDGWIWVTGEPVTYENWFAPGVPNNTGNFVTMGLGQKAGGWNDEVSSPTAGALERIIVEFEPGFQPPLVETIRVQVCDNEGANLGTQRCLSTAVDLGILPQKRNASLKTQGGSFVSFSGFGSQGQRVLDTFARSQERVEILYEYKNRDWIKLTVDSEHHGIRSLDAPYNRYVGEVNLRHFPNPAEGQHNAGSRDIVFQNLDPPHWPTSRTYYLPPIPQVCPGGTREPMIACPPGTGMIQIRNSGENTGILSRFILNFEEIEPPIPGDANFDGDVDFADFLKLSSNFGGSGAWVDGNFDGHLQFAPGRRAIDFSDFLLLSANFGATTTAAISVPEPRSAVLLLLLFVAGWFKKWRR